MHTIQYGYRQDACTHTHIYSTEQLTFPLILSFNDGPFEEIKTLRQIVEQMGQFLNQLIDSSGTTRPQRGQINSYEPCHNIVD